MEINENDDNDEEEVDEIIEHIKWTDSYSFRRLVWCKHNIMFDDAETYVCWKNAHFVLDIQCLNTAVHERQHNRKGSKCAVLMPKQQVLSLSTTTQRHTLAKPVVKLPFAVSNSKAFFLVFFCVRYSSSGCCATRAPIGECEATGLGSEWLGNNKIERERETHVFHVFTCCCWGVHKQAMWGNARCCGVSAHTTSDHGPLSWELNETQSKLYTWARKTRLRN